MEEYLRDYVSHEGKIVEGRDGDLGNDLYAVWTTEDDEFVTYGTGVTIAPEDSNLNFLVFPRSSLCNYDLMLNNSVGVIDSSYRGEIKLIFRKVGAGERIYKNGDKIAQLVAFRKINVNFIPVQSVNKDTERGDGGFGSTGK